MLYYLEWTGIKSNQNELFESKGLFYIFITIILICVVIYYEY